MSDLQESCSSHTVNDVSFARTSPFANIAPRLRSLLTDRGVHTHTFWGVGSKPLKNQLQAFDAPLMKAFHSRIDYGVKMSFCRGL